MPNFPRTDLAVEAEAIHRSAAAVTELPGVRAEETERMLTLLAALKAEHAILLVEHDMDAVFRIADRITVMVNGTVVATGTPAQIRVDPVVRTAYLGEDHA